MPEDAPHPTREPIAVIGVGCVLPDAPDVASFWRNLLAGRSSIREVPTERWDPALFYSPERNGKARTYSKIGAFVSGFGLDPRRFRIPPNVLKSVDPSQLWALAATDQAFRDSGYDARPFDRSRCAVIVGACGSEEMRTPTALHVMIPAVMDELSKTPSFQALPPTAQANLLREWEERALHRWPNVTEDSMTGELSSLVAGRIANQFNLTGKSFTTDAACASSIAAVDAAVSGLRTGEFDLAVVGGSDHNQAVSMYVKFARLGALSATGSHPFDERADGFVMGEGCAIFLLKRLSDARRDGDKVRALILGVGSSSDGKGRSLTAPSVDGQALCLERALRSAGVSADSIDVVECHGTATPLGDAVEVEALRRVYGAARPLTLGSVKSNIGHLKGAAGAAGLLKAILTLEHGVIAPQSGFTAPNPRLGLDGSRFVVAREATRWPGSGRPRRMAVSSFGFGGTNFHAVLGQAPDVAARDTLRAPEAEPRALVLSEVAKASGYPAAVLTPELRLLADLGLSEAQRTAVLDAVLVGLGVERNGQAPPSTIRDLLALAPARPERAAYQPPPASSRT
ncbi:MAG: polyketide synthase [Euryarchaeota archaeon]|nr:polyketide synthase [Euryarchaeota archaeon]